MYYNPTITRPDLLERLLEFDDEVLTVMNRIPGEERISYSSLINSTIKNSP